MYVLSFVDYINESYGPDSVNGAVQIISVSEDKDVLKTKTDGEVMWERNDMNQDVGRCLYDGEVDNDQFYIIVEV